MRPPHSGNLINKETIMAGAAIVVLWSAITTLQPSTIQVPLPYLSSNARITEIVASTTGQVQCPFSLSIGTAADKYTGILPIYNFNSLYENSETEVASETNAAFVPANTIETMQLSACGQNTTKMIIEVLGYQVTQ